MYKKHFLSVIAALLFCGHLAAQNITTVASLEGEYWWGGAVGIGEQMPYVKPLAEYDLALENSNNQVVPLLLSSKGRYVWSDKPFRFELTKAGIRINSAFEKIAVCSAGSTLRDAYLDACRKHFPPAGTLPDTLFFTMPQYNTWIELMYNQNQVDVEKYAQAIVDNGFPTGVLMVDDNWQKYYGSFEFKPERFPDPKKMVQALHSKGFRVMLWICPFVSADCPEYRELARKGFLIKNKRTRQPAVISWWNGQSACYDFTNPEAVAYFVGQLRQLQQKYGIDGFKFDGGDNHFYARPDLQSYKPDAISTDHTEAWARIGLAFQFNEYRAGWRMGGEPLVQRLGDKNYSWKAVGQLIPQMTAAGLLGYAYACPDMIGGGQFGSFLNVDQTKLDQELIVRSAQVHAMMPMMQFSVAPWRVLDAEHLSAVRDMALLHERMGAYIIRCARESAKTGEPIVRCMEYAFPNQGYAECRDMFMLGEKYLVAPMVTKGAARTLRLPKGKWKDEFGKLYQGGGEMNIGVPIGRLPYFERIQ